MFLKEGFSVEPENKTRAVIFSYALGLYFYSGCNKVKTINDNVFAHLFFIGRVFIFPKMNF